MANEELKAAKFEEWFDATSESSFRNAISQIQLLYPSVSLRLDLSVTQTVDGSRLMEVLGSGERLEVPLEPPQLRRNEELPEGSHRDLGVTYGDVSCNPGGS